MIYPFLYLWVFFASINKAAISISYTHTFVYETDLLHGLNLMDANKDLKKDNPSEHTILG